MDRAEGDGDQGIKNHHVERSTYSICIGIFSEVMMARKEQQLTCTFFVNGQPVEKLTKEQLDTMAQRLGDTMSTYYTAHPEEYQNIRRK